MDLNQQTDIDICLNQEIGKRLKEFRDYRDITQEKLAQELEMDKHSISKCENGKQALSLDALCKIKDKWNIDLNVFIAGSEIDKKYIRSFPISPSLKEKDIKYIDAFIKCIIKFITIHKNY